jgi:ABC-type uncharacterized transport system permease subunit
MTAETTLIRSEGRTRREIMFGVLFLALAVWILFILAAGTAGVKSTLQTTSQRGGVTIPGPDFVLPTDISLYVIGGIIALIGIWQLVRGFERVNLWIVITAGGSVLAFLIWATQDKSINLTGMLVSSLVRATPIALASLSGIWSERSGVINIGIEGMMLTGAFTSVVIASVTDSMLLGILAGIVSGMLLALLHGWLSIRYKTDQIISGAVLIILALGLTSYLHRAILEVNVELNTPGPAIPAFAIPGLWKIPIIGPVLFNQSPIIYLLYLLIIATAVIMNQTRWGLRIRSVGEHPRAADTLGINVNRLRYISVVVSGALAGLSGAYMAIGSAGRFNEGMTAGKGFLGLAGMIFGNYDPSGAFFGSLIFGFFDSWQEKLALLQIGIPGEIFAMAPYLATMIVLAGIIGRARVPAADGIPYEKE